MRPLALRMLHVAPRTSQFARQFAGALVLLCACLSSACLVLNVQPIYDENSLEVDETLTGTWQADEQPMTLVIERGEWKSYRVTYTSRNTSYDLVAYLTKIDNSYFVDISSARGVAQVPLLVPVHGLARLQHSGDTLTVSPLNYDWMVAAQKAGRLPKLTATLDARQNLLVTSKTDVLRAWLQSILKSTDAWREPVVFHR